MGKVVVFFNSIHSLVGRVTTGVGSAMISSITMSYRFWLKQKAGKVTAVSKKTSFRMIQVNQYITNGNDCIKNSALYFVH
jgi:hypothetical protein